ncbi:XVIPCD domain-containing protein [Lysobacter enzymogenes]|uniref:XVIPCD domain-containing protein n=1 Tax=Lysobacter enzymogenes TaxID=69 RepID=UPI001A9733D9|nr:XVIPCD domain-containing protein [Lysobacter enzymogenes]QQP97314.1 hypothetical protein JHW38_04530 [Lysobacter enzymogenes]
MPFQLFRTDNRDPDTIARDGFQARAPMSADAARQFVERSVVDANTPLNLPVAAQRGVMADYFARNQSLVGLGSLYQEIRRETSQSTLHVSTSPSDGTGGIRSRHLYEIEVPAQRLYAWQEGRLGRISATPTEVSSLAEAHPINNSLGLPPTRPVLLTDAPTLRDSTMFAISSPSGEGEVAFLTGIPREWTQRSRALAEGGGWQPMPAPAQGLGASTVATPVATPAAPVASSSSVSSPAVPTPSTTPVTTAPVASTSSLSSPAVSLSASNPGSSSASPAMPWTASASSTQDHAEGRRPPPVPARPLSMLTHPYQEAGHSRHEAYEQARDGLQRLQPQRPAGERSLAAAALADAAHNATPPLPRIDHVAEGPNGRLFAVHGELGNSAARYAHADPAQVKAQAQVVSDYAAGRLAASHTASASQRAPAAATPGQQPQAPNVAQAPQQQQQEQPAQQEGNRVRALAAMFEASAADQNQNQGGQNSGGGPRHR